MAQPEQAQPTDPATFPPDEVLVRAFRLEVHETGGQRFLMLHHINRREVLMLDLNDEAAADRLAGEIKPSRVVRTNANGTSW